MEDYKVTKWIFYTKCGVSSTARVQAERKNYFSKKLNWLSPFDMNMTYVISPEECDIVRVGWLACDNITSGFALKYFLSFCSITSTLMHILKAVLSIWQDNWVRLSQWIQFSNFRSSILHFFRNLINVVVYFYIFHFITKHEARQCG